MATNDDVIIVGKLDDKELRKSIDDLVNYVGNQTSVMASSFVTSMDMMKGAMKDFAVTQKVSVDLIKESWKTMSDSFDAMFRAQSDATGGGKGSGRATYADHTVGALEQEIATLKQERKEMELNSDVLREQNKIIDERQRKLKEQTTSLATLRLDKTLRMPSNDLDEARKKLSRLEAVQRLYKGSTELSEQQQKRLTDAIVRTRKEIDKLNSSKPKTLKDVLGMDESTVDAVAKKMRALRTVTINPQNRNEVNALGNEYQRLSRLQADLLGKGIQLTHSNNYLAQSFGYIRNRIVYAMTLGAATNFVKQMYEIRGQYELLERSLGILIDDMRKGKEMFEELNKMALKSPFTLVELATGAKQLLAYNFAEEEVVDTTRRLADISAALGVPMERLVYNLGQIKAQTALTARDARDFANAGLAIVPMLAQMYTEQKRFGNEIVTTAQVFDMMSKKLVKYDDVMQVINKVTDEGGKFFDFQAKQADTLRVKMANLTLAWNNMLNEMGSENQTALVFPIKALKMLFENWRLVSKAITEVVVAYGAYRAAALVANALNSRMFVGRIIVNWRNYVAAVKSATGAMATFNAVTGMSPLGAFAAVLGAVVGYFTLFNDSVEDANGNVERFGAAGAKVVSDVKSLFDALIGISKESSTYTKVMNELNSILEEHGVELVNETDSIDALNEKRRVAISLIQQETLERKHLNDIQEGNEKYESTVNEARNKMKEALKGALTRDIFVTGNDEIRQNADAIAKIISDVVEQNISLVANKTGDEYVEGVDKVFAIIRERLSAVQGLSKETIEADWLENGLFSRANIIEKFVETLKDAKDEQIRYKEAIDEAYESEKKAIESGAGFNDRVNQTQRSLMKAATDTENFYKKINQLIKDYSGENIIDFLVKVRTEVPAWMAQKGLTELTQLSARFTALATQAKKAGKDSLDFGKGNVMTVEQMFVRAAQYAQAAQNKAASIEARKSSTITREASEALKEYKSAIEAVNVAKNMQKRGTADATLVQEKETEAQNKYNKAFEKGVSLEELRKAKQGKGGGSKKDPLGDALTKEIQLIGDIQKMYKDYQKAGVDADTARIASAKEYEKSLKATNATLSKFGVKGINGEDLATMDLRALRDYYKEMLKVASAMNNTKGVEALEKAIRGLNEQITKVDYKRITDGLNNELSKLKDEYELAVELDASPELGGMFADLFNIDVDALPRTFDQALAKVQASVNNALEGLNIDKSFDVLKDDVHAFAQSVGQSLDSTAIKELEKAQTYIRGLWKKTTNETIKDWNTLLEKYGDLQTKLVRAAQETAKEQLEIVRRFGNTAEQTQALDLTNKITLTTSQDEVARLQQELNELVKKVVAGNDVGVKLEASVEQADLKKKASIAWNDFKDSDYYTMMFENMDRLSKRAIRSILAQLDMLRDKVKEDPASMKALMDSYKKGRDELEKRTPFENIINGLKEWRRATMDVITSNKLLAAADKELKDAKEELDSAQQASKSPSSGSGSDTARAERLAKAQERYAKAVRDKNEAEKNAAKAEIAQVAAQAKFKNALDASAQTLQNVGSLLTQFTELLGITEDSEAGQMVRSIAQGFTMMASALSMVAAVAVIVEASLSWVAIVAAALAALIGLFTFLSGQSNRKITAQIEEIERDVHDLEIAYKNLEQAADEAYGAMTSGAKAALLANKQAQLEDLERQLELAKSRSGKDYDQGEIDNYQSEIVDLRNEIRDLTQEITNDLLDISSAGDGITDLVDVMIDAFKNGEDAMEAFGKKWDEMIDNMILKMLVSTFMQKAWDDVMQTLSDKEQEFLDRASKEQSDAQKNYDKVLDMTDDEVAKLIADQLGYEKMRSVEGYSFSEMEQAAQRGDVNYYNGAGWIEAWQQVTDEEIAAYRKLLTDTVNNADSATSKASMDYTKWALDYMNHEGRDYMMKYAEMLEASLGDWYTYGQTSKAELSSLQQGIQGVTETTAGAIEAYMNGVSQQVYLQSELLTEIRDTVAGLNSDVLVASMSQMLLQLQQSYAVQMAIQGILEGWSTPSGLAVRVEMA